MTNRPGGRLVVLFMNKINMGERSERRKHS